MDAHLKHLLESYVNDIDQAHKKYNEKHFPDLHKSHNGEFDKFSIVYGKRFAKVLNRNAVHCFVEISTGDIYKAATWSAPAKGKRGNLQDLKRPLFCSDFYR